MGMQCTMVIKPAAEKTSGRMLPEQEFPSGYIRHPILTLSLSGDGNSVGLSNQHDRVSANDF